VGGIGALPGGTVGAAVGTQVGLWILAALGLKSLAEFFLEGLPEILKSYYKGFSEAWAAGYDEATTRSLAGPSQQSFQLNVAAGYIAEGHVAVVMLLLSAVVAYLTRGRGSMQVLAREAGGGRLGPRFAAWLLKHEDRLREHPNLQPRAPRSRAAGGGGERLPPSPPPPPPPRRGEHEPRGPGKMPRKDVRCFKPNGLPAAKVGEFDRQIKGQERGINELSVDEYLKGRKAFDEGEVTRSRTVAKDARTTYREELNVALTKQLRDGGVSPKQAEQQAVQLATEKMKTLAALHNPDMVAGGRDAIGDFGDRNVNSRIGAQWNSGKKSRLSELDDAAKAVPERDRAGTKMNAKLERCK
jgi:Novel toxin 15